MATDHAAAAAIEWGIRAGMQGAQIAFSTYVANKQFGLAQEYSNRAQEIHNEQIQLLRDDLKRWKDKAAGAMDSMLDEATSQPIVVANYHGEAAQTLAFVRMQSGISAKKIYECASNTCIGMTKQDLKELKFREASLGTSAIQMALRREELDVERRNALRRDLRSQAISMARNAYDGSNRSATLAAQSYGQIAAAAGAGMSSSLQSLGYGLAGLGQSVQQAVRGQRIGPLAPVEDRVGTQNPNYGYNNPDYGQTSPEDIAQNMLRAPDIQQMVGADDSSALGNGAGSTPATDSGGSFQNNSDQPYWEL